MGGAEIHRADRRLMPILAIGKWLIGSRAGNIVGLALIAAIAYGVIYARGYFAAERAQEIKQFKNNELATKERREIDRAVPRTDWDDRVDELR